MTQKKKNNRKIWIFPAFLFVGLFAFARKKKQNPANLYLPNNKYNIVDYQIIRECDPAGCGYFGASRDHGVRTHKGIDIVVQKGQNVYSPIAGKIRLSYPYDNHKLKGVEVSGNGNEKIQIFYFNPVVKNNDIVEKGQFLGKAQSVSEYYNSPNMTDHLHVQMKINNQIVNPTPYFV